MVSPIPGATGPTLLLGSPGLSSEGEYSVGVSGPLGTTTSDATSFTFIPTPTLTGLTSFNQIDAAGVPGASYLIEWSDDLLVWNELGQFTADNTTGAIQAFDAHQTRRFYRITVIF